ncbi:MAG: TonB-dependent receptor [Segetibacter sp.]|nr:TonB-dependent receptor [Segetibacter sp.]
MKCMAKSSLQKLTVAILFLLIAASHVIGQSRTVTGRVTNVAGEPLAGATISVVGSQAGTSADTEGSFTIAVPVNGSVRITAVGYADQVIKVTNQTTVIVTLQPAANQLEQVVVVGYGTQRKESVTGSVASIGGDRLRDVPTSNISQALQGRVAGVDISQTSSRPGATTQIRIRGDRSLTGSNDPLIVLDGIPFIGSLGDINPNDIKSIDILKDASATAIYGSRGSNGVILVTTNRGQRGQKSRISYNTYTGIQTVFAKYPMMNGPEFVALRKAAGLYQNNLDEADNVNTDWQDLIFRNGLVTDHSLSLVGGGQQGSYNFGMGYYQNQAVIPSQQYKRYSMKAALDQQVGKYFRFGVTSNNNYNVSQGNQIGLYANLSATPIANPYNPDGTLRKTIRMAADEQYVLTKERIDSLNDRGTWVNETRGFATYNSLYGEISVPWVRGLKYRLNVGADFVQNNNGNFTGQGVNNINPTSVSGAGISNTQTYHWTLENILTYDRTFAGKHNLNLVGLYSSEQNKINGSSLSATDIPSEAFQFYNLGQAAGQITVNPANQSYQVSGLMSYMGRAIYSYENRYLLTATVRSDASSRLAPGYQWHTYPAVSVGWNMANESFMRNISAINSLKLRAGYGQTSNQAVAPYSTLGLLSSRPYNFGPTGYATGYYVSAIPNPSLGWEYSKTLNLGIDFGLFHSRVSGTIEYYNTKTEGILQSVSLPPTSGVGSIVQNVGKTQNQGIELSLSGTILNNVNGWTWDAGFNIYANRNKLVALANGSQRDEANAWFVGHNINAIFDYQKIGLWQKDDPYRSVLEPGVDSQIVGSIKVMYAGGYDANGKPTRAIGTADRQIMDVDPDFQGGFNTRVSYKGFDFSTVGVFKSGGILVSTVYGSAGYLNLETGRRNNVKIDYWTPDNTDAKYPRPGRNVSGDNPKYGSTLMYFDASFLKIRTISLGYDFNHSLLKNPDIRLRMYATVQNPFVLFSPYNKESGMDPETNSYGNENAAVNLSSNLRRILTIGTNTPSTRNYILGLNVTF